MLYNSVKWLWSLSSHNKPCSLNLFVRYREANLKCLNSVRCYSNSVPVILHNRPEHFVKHCMDRLPPSVAVIEKDAIEILSPSCFSVPSEERTDSYQQLMDDPSCTCRDWKRHSLPCKHMLGVAMCFGWHLLPARYIDNPLFVLDYSVIRGAPEAVNVEQTSAREAVNMDCMSAPEAVNVEQTSARELVNMDCMNAPEAVNVEQTSALEAVNMDCMSAPDAVNVEQTSARDLLSIYKG